MLPADAWQLVAMNERPLADYIKVMEHGRPWLVPERIDAWLMHRFFGAWSWLAMQGEQPVGAVVAIPETAPSKALYVDQLVVAENYRRRGLARAMVRRCERRACAEGLRSLWLCTDPRNPAAHWWQGLGFTAQSTDCAIAGWPVRRDFKGAGKDRVLFVKPVPSSLDAADE